MEKTRQSENETRARIAEAEAAARKEEYALKRLELSMMFNQRNFQTGDNDIELRPEVLQNKVIVEQSNVSEQVSNGAVSSRFPEDEVVIPLRNEEDEEEEDEKEEEEEEEEKEEEEEEEAEEAENETDVIQTTHTPLLHSPTNGVVSYAGEGRIAVKLIRAQLVETYLIELLESRTLPVRIPLQTFVIHFNNWLVPPPPGIRRYHRKFSDRMIVNPMKAYESCGITKNRAQHTRQYLIDHDKFRAKLVADGKISLDSDAAVRSSGDNDDAQIHNADLDRDIRKNYAKERAAQKEKTLKGQQERAELVDKWLIHQLKVQELPTKILNSQMLQIFNEWLNLDNRNPRSRRYHRAFSHKLLQPPLLSYEQHGLARLKTVNGLEIRVDYIKLRAKFIEDGKIRGPILRRPLNQVP